MSSEQQTASEEKAPDQASAPEQPKLRRRPLGYSKRDVRSALERQSAELSAREAELAELRQDIAALWLAFAQHDRMIRRALGEDGSGPSPASPGRAEDAETAAAAEAEAEDDAAIGKQLSDLDDVLAAIELATQTLERTYVEKKGTPPPPPGDAPAAGGKPAQS